MAHALEEGSGNHFLQALPRSVAERLAEQLKAAPLARGTVLVHAGALAGHLYFPDRGLISLVKIMDDGRTAEIGCVGMRG